MARRAGWVVGLGVVVAGLAAVSSARTGPILHEFFVIPAEEAQGAPGAGGGEPGELSGDGPVEGAGDEGEGLPGSLGEELSGKDLPPPLSVENRGDELELGADGRATTPDGEALSQHNGPFRAEDLARPDRQTTLDEDLTYFEVFNPAIVPWKRGMARDEVHADYSLGVKDRRVYEIKVEDKPIREDHERFWGSLLIHAEPGVKVPLPSVSPRAEVLRYQTEPPTVLQFYRDMADNFYVSTTHRGALRVNFLMEAHAGYFGGEVDPKVRVEDLERKLRPKLPPTVQAAGEEMLGAIGVDRGAGFREQLSTLVEYFRSFEAKDFPMNEASEDIYKDLVLQKLGVCRHRAFAFVVTAQAAGMLARYVNNEAHSFVEVMVPRRGWLRIDLGGAAVDFDVHNSMDKVLHVPPEPDSLPQPKEFASSYSHRLGRGEPEADVNGDGEEESLDGVPENLSRQRPGPADQPQDSSPNDDAPTPEELGFGEPPGSDAPPEGQDGATPAGPPLKFPRDPNDPNPVPEGAPSEAAPSARTTLKLLEVRTQDGPSGRAKAAFRGDELVVEGELRVVEGEPMSEQPVRAYLVPKGQFQPDEFRLVGEGTSDARGRVKLKVKIPETVALGPWSIYLYFAGAQGFRESHSE
jgi:hypothetical protein